MIDDDGWLVSQGSLLCLFSVELTGECQLPGFSLESFTHSAVSPPP